MIIVNLRGYILLKIKVMFTKLFVNLKLKLKDYFLQKFYTFSLIGEVSFKHWQNILRNKEFTIGYPVHILLNKTVLLRESIGIL